MSETGNSSLNISWKEIEKNLGSMAATDGGFTAAHRGIVTLPRGECVFVKIGVDEQTKNWSKKEVRNYRYLQRHDYPFAPKLLAANADNTSIALEPLTVDDGWDWSDNWSEERLAITLEAMDKLATLTPEDAASEQIDTKTIFEFDNGWQPLNDTEPLRQKLLAKLRKAGRGDIADSLDISTMAKRSAAFAFSNDVLVHNDVRGDNCAWNPGQQTVKLVDWNWAGLGDRRIDINALLVSVQKSGLDVLQYQADRLDAEALIWLAGFWLHQSATPIWPGGPERLRDFQLQSGLVALDLASKC